MPGEGWLPAVSKTKSLACVLLAYTSTNPISTPGRQQLGAKSLFGITAAVSSRQSHRLSETQRSPGTPGRAQRLPRQNVQQGKKGFLSEITCKSNYISILTYLRGNNS